MLNMFSFIVGYDIYYSTLDRVHLTITLPFANDSISLKFILKPNTHFMSEKGIKQKWWAQKHPYPQNQSS